MQKKKLLGSALALAMVVPYSQASAELLKNLKVDGSFEFAGVAADNVTDFATNENPAPAAQTNRDKIGSMQHRILLGLGFDLLDDVHAKTTLHKNNRVYGNASQTIDGVTATVEVVEANVKIDKLMGAVDLTLGRQFYGNQGDLVAYFGPRNDYGLNTDALDAVRFDWAGEMMNLTGIAGKRDDGGALAAAQNGDRDLRGLILGLKGHENVNAGAYVWNQVTRNYGAAAGVPASEAAVGGRNDKLWVAGLKGKLMMGGLWAGAEFAKNFGVNRQAGSTQVLPTQKYKGWGFLADAGAKIDVDGLAAFTPWGQFGIGTGDEDTRDNENDTFQMINTDYRPGALYGRFHNGSDVALGSSAGIPNNAAVVASNGLSNRVIWGVGLKVTPAAASKLTAGLSYWDFRRHRATRSPNVGPAGDGAKRIGNELDVELGWTHSDNVWLGLTLAKFMPGSLIENTVQSTNANGTNVGSGQGLNSVYMGAFDVKIKWGGQQ